MPISPRSLSLILPAFEEERTIAAELRSLRAFFEAHGEPFELVVVADGNDATAEEARRATANDGTVVVIESRARRGKGHAIRRGAAVARYARIGYADADGKTPITEYDAVARWLDAGDVVVIGTRHAPGARIEREQRWYRRLGSRGFRALVHGLGLSDLSDTQCGFKFFRADVARALFAHSRIDGYMFDVEILALARRAGHRIREVPVRWRDDGDSRLELVRGNAANLRDLVRIRRALGVSAASRPS